MRTNKFCFLLCMLCVLTFAFPLNAMAGVFIDPEVTGTEYFSGSGSLKSMSINFYWGGADCTSRLMLVSKPLKGSNEYSSAYGELTNLGQFGSSFKNFEEAMAYDQ